MNRHQEVSGHRCARKAKHSFMCRGPGRPGIWGHGQQSRRLVWILKEDREAQALLVGELEGAELASEVSRPGRTQVGVKQAAQLVRGARGQIPRPRISARLPAFVRNLGS